MGGIHHPHRSAKGSAADQALAQPVHLGFRLRLIDMFEPIHRPRYRAGIQGWFASPPCGDTRPWPQVGTVDQAGPERVAFDVTQHGQEMLVFLDREAAKTALPHVTARMVVAV